ncbi:MAG: Calx-beta domain-containing protein [Candidatus Peribacteraceae bacterium]|jgi:hypothetical protein
MAPRFSVNKYFLVTFLLGIGAGVALTTGAGAALTGSAVFPDVRSGTFYDEAVGEMYGEGIIKGFEDGTFHPEDYVTRGQVAVLFKRLRDEINGVLPAPSSSGEATAGSSVSSRSSSRRSSSSSSRSSAAATSVNGAFRLAAPTFSIPDVAPTLSLSILRTGGDKGQVTVAYTLSGGTAVASTDYVPTKGVLTFKDGEGSKNVSARLLRNTGATGSRTVNFTLSDPTGGAVLGDPSGAVVTLSKGLSTGSSSSSSSSAAGGSNAAGGTFIFSAAGYGVLENAGTATITVTRTGTVSAAATVEFATVNASASAGTHYETNGGTLSFAAGETSKTFSVRVTDNATADGNKALNLELRTPTAGAVLGLPSRATLTIMDNESVATGSGIIRLEQPSYTVNDTDGNAYVTILRAGTPTGTASVNYETLDSTARNNADYTRVSGTVSFTPGEMKKIIAIPLLEHAGDAGEIQFYFRISNASGNATLGSQVEATVTIQG